MSDIGVVPTPKVSGTDGVSKVPDFHSAPLPLRPGRLSGEAGHFGWRVMVGAAWQYGKPWLQR